MAGAAVGYQALTHRPPEPFVRLAQATPTGPDIDYECDASGAEVFVVINDEGERFPTLTGRTC